MEGVPSGDIQVKYQKLASEYSKLRVHVKVLKKGVLDEQAKSNELRDQVKEKDKSLRKYELEIDSLSFRNQQLTKRISVLQDELDAVQLKLNKKTRNKADEKQSTSTAAATLDRGLMQEELQKKILENAQLASQLSDRVFEVSQLNATLEDYQKILAETDNRHKCEIAKLKNKNQELQFTLEEISKDRNNGTAKQHLAPSSSIAASCNGDFLSEGGSIIGSEDALSSVDDLHVNEQLCFKTQQNLEQENQRIKMELELLQMENESLKLEVKSKRSRSECHDSGDFNTFSETCIDGEGRVTGLIGSLDVPFVLNEEIVEREERMKKYFRSKITELAVEKQQLESKTEDCFRECEMLRLRYEEAEKEKNANDQTLQHKHNTISRLEEELHSTSTNYEQQMGVLSEHVADLNDKLSAQYDLIQRLKMDLTRKK